MKVETMRRKLQMHCSGSVCSECCLGEDFHRCGTGVSFTSRDSEDWDMTDDEIIKAYHKVFGVDDKVVDMVNHPPHYEVGGIECIDVMQIIYGKEAVKNFCMCNAFKYLFRTNRKNGAEDVDKAIWYLNKWKELSTNE